VLLEALAASLSTKTVPQGDRIAFAISNIEINIFVFFLSFVVKK
jgi:hypothetical protein